METTTKTSIPNTVRFAETLRKFGLDRISDDWIVNEDGTAEMINTGHGWIVRAADAAIETGVLLDRWDAARVLRDWDDDDSDADDDAELVAA